MRDQYKISKKTNSKIEGQSYNVLENIFSQSLHLYSHFEKGPLKLFCPINHDRRERREWGHILHS